jgi:ankyrin repeat protein
MWCYDFAHTIGIFKQFKSVVNIDSPQFPRIPRSNKRQRRAGWRDLPRAAAHDSILQFTTKELCSRLHSTATALVLGVHGTADCARVLIAAGADVNAKTTDKGNTALMQAAFSGSLDGVKALIAAKANVNATNNFGQTPLSVVIDMGKSECVKISN